MHCRYPECETPLTPSGRGRPPRYCEEHRKGKYRTARSRARGTVRPPCCQEADGKNLKCPQHKEDPPARRTRNHWGEYAGALPRIIHGTQPRMPDRSALDDVETVEEMFTLLSDSLGYKEIASSGLGIKGERAALEMPPMSEWMREQYSDGSGFIPVIGQTDLDAYWRPVNPSWREEFGESAYAKPRHTEWTTLVTRGPAWPWATETEKVAA